MFRGLYVPASHTAFSWLRVGVSRAMRPQSHTTFSWRQASVQANGNGNGHANSVGGVAKSNRGGSTTTNNDGDGDGNKARDYLVDIDANFLSEVLLKDATIDQHIQAADEVNVRRFVLPCASMEDVPKVIELAQNPSYVSKIFPCVGVHPYWSMEVRMRTGTREHLCI